MAVSTSNRFYNGASVGIPQVGTDFNRLEKNTNPKFKIGHKIEDGDGNTYRYAQFGADTNRGLVVSQDISESSMVDTDNDILAPASCVNTDDGKIGEKHIEITKASTTANQYAGARLIITDDVGEGYTYNIVGNTATGNPATGTVRFQIKEKLQVALTAASDYCIVGNKYANLEGETSTDTAACGVSCATMDVSEAPYGWVQTKGVVGILTAGTVVLGNTVTTSAGITGAVAPATSARDPQIGRCLIVGDDTGHSAIDVNFE